ncbi:non-ribosomal peptide synthetase [Jidongwangia harbinensis]|uniref:non-ribosomal peptide synthetase n=1 Tax=Jidongwangia harbinensis TaxID=2878561 RepID=UPI001CD93B4C|nr:non-ribosomal peptide synthetase [Jidongwangia harbinensis]MCA2218366.1 amino acid adenylation domain-containing protein [Jidongwangia harbinensis]
MDIHPDTMARIAALSPHKQELLAARLRGRPATASRPRTTIPSRSSATPPLSFAQQRMWFLDQLDPGSPHYTIPMAARINGPVDVVALEGALNDLVRRHESLRTTFALTDSGPVQVVHEKLWLPLPVTDLTGQADRDAAADELVLAQARQPFDLAAGPLVRFGLIRLAPDRQVLTAAMHHIIADTWSIGIILRELAITYESLRHGQPAPLPAPAVQYPDYAEWQRNRLHGAELDRQVDYWRGRLDGDLSPLELPTDRPRPAEQSYRGAQYVHWLPAGLAERIDALGATAGTTVFTVLLAGLSVLLHRYSGRDRIGIGAPIANRGSVELEELIGYLSNTVLLRTDLSGDPTFREVLARAHETVLGAQTHQELPFDKVVELVRPERTASATPLLQVVLVYQNEAVGGAADMSGLPGLGAAIPIDNGTAKFDLTFSVEPNLGAYRIAVEYATDLYDRATVAAMTAHLEQLLRAATGDPDTAIGDLPLMRPAERHELVVGWNATAAPFPADRCLHELIEERARARPGDVAAVCAGEQITYRELTARANRLAHHLRALGAGPDVPVAISLPRSIDLVVAMLGVLKAGSAYLPLDPAYPAERLSLMLADAAPPVLITLSSLASRLPAPDGGTVVCLDTAASALAAQPDTTPESGVRPQHLAYVIYTSGSTGRPKGVQLDHRGRVNNFHDFNTRFAIGPGDSLLALASLSFDMSAYDVLGTLMAGARIVLVDADAGRDPARWLELMRRHRVSVWHSVPALLDMLVTYAEAADGDALMDLRLVLLGGDWVGLTLPDRLRAVARAAEVVTMGGATEVSMDSTIFRVDTVEPSWRSIPYGRPMANQRCYVLDARLQPVPVGVPGDLYLAGVGLGRGYLGDPVLTGAKFIVSPVPEEPGERIYRTGDRARYLRDGNLELLGRSDFQLKIRGWRVEPGEIESALREHPEVRDALVVPWDDAAGVKHLAGYVVADGELDLAAVRAFLHGRLPAQLVPDLLVPLDAFPLTANGKLDRKGLPDPQTGAGALGPAYVAPRNRVEAVLAEVWQELLGVERVGMDDNFFALGGDSISTIQVIARLRRRGLVLTPKQMFQYQTIGLLAALATDTELAGPAAADDDVALVDPALVERLRAHHPDLEDVYPLAPMQRRMLARAVRHPVPGLYVIHADYLFVTGGLDVDALARAWQLIVDRHPTLRTSFRWPGDAADDPRAPLTEPLQLVHRDVAVTVQHHDWRDADVDEQVRRQDELVAADRRLGFDLTRAPLLRIHLLRIADDTWKYVFANHHVVLDGWSRAIVQQEVFKAYEALRTGARPDLPDARPLRDYMAWLRRGDLADAERFWRDYLDGFTSPTPLVAARGLPGATQRGPFAKQREPLGDEVNAELAAFCRRYPVTANSVLQGAWFLLMSRWTGRSDLVLGVTSAGRSTDFAGVDTVTGLCVNTLPVRVRVDPAATVTDWLGQLQAQQVEVRQYEYTPLDLINTWQGRAPDAAMFECMMVFENYPWDGSLLALADRMDIDHPLAQPDYQTAQFEFPLRVEVAPGRSALLIMHYYQDSFADETVTAMIGDWRATVRAMVAAPHQTLGRLIGDLG